MVWHVLATESSVPTWRRVSAQDATVAGHAIPAGAEILLELTGTHDLPGEQEEDLTLLAGTARRRRPTAYGLVFGSGIHRCLGARLAELEATVIVQETAAALPQARLRDHEPDWIRHLSFQAPKTVTVMAGKC